MSMVDLICAFFLTTLYTGHDLRRHYACSFFRGTWTDREHMFVIYRGIRRHEVPVKRLLRQDTADVAPC